MSCIGYYHIVFLYISFFLELIIDLFLSLALFAHFYHQFNYKLSFRTCVLASTGAVKKSKVILSHNLLSTIYSSSTNLKDLFSVHPANQPEILGMPGSESLQGSGFFSKFGIWLSWAY